MRVNCCWACILRMPRCRIRETSPFMHSFIRSWFVVLLTRVFRSLLRRSSSFGFARALCVVVLRARFFIEGEFAHLRFKGLQTIENPFAKHGNEHNGRGRDEIPSLHSGADAAARRRAGGVFEVMGKLVKCGKKRKNMRN